MKVLTDLLDEISREADKLTPEIFVQALLRFGNWSEEDIKRFRSLILVYKQLQTDYAATKITIHRVNKHGLPAKKDYHAIAQGLKYTMLCNLADIKAYLPISYREINVAPVGALMFKLA